MRAWAVPLVLIVLVVTVPLWLPAVLVLNAIYRRRLRKAAESFACAKCGKTLGTDALKRANAAWAEHMRELHSRHPGARLRTVRTFHAICGGCGTRYVFLDRERTFAVQGAA